MSYIDMASDHIASLYPLIVYHQPRIMDLPPGAILGTWAYSVPGTVRYILARDIEIAPGVMPGDLARAWIRDQYKLPIKRRKNQLEHGYPSPLHARSGSYGDCVYVDLRHAYLTVLKFGYDVEYRRGYYIGAEPQSVPAEVAANKYVYATAVTMSRNPRANLEVMGKEGIIKRNPFNLFSNPCLYALANDTLNGIGAEIIAVLGEQCVYVNTDGYIIRAEYERYALDIIASWGFEARVKYRGETEVKGVASFRVGEHKTATYHRKTADHTGPLMTRDERRWLKTRWVKWYAKLQSDNDPSRIDR